MMKLHRGTERRVYWRCCRYELQAGVVDNGAGCGCNIKDDVIRDIVDKYLAYAKRGLQNDEQNNAHEVYLGNLRARFEAMDFGEPDPARIADIDAGIEQHKTEKENIAERALKIPQLAETDVFANTMNEHTRAITDLEYEKRQLLEQPTREELLQKIADAEQACTDGERRRYTELLKAVISRIICYARPIPAAKRKGRQKYELVGVKVIPTNAGVVPFPDSLHVFDDVKADVPCLCYEPLPGCTYTTGTDENAIGVFTEQVKNSWEENLPRDNYGVPIIP